MAVGKALHKSGGNLTSAAEAGKAEAMNTLDFVVNFSYSFIAIIYIFYSVNKIPALKAIQLAAELAIDISNGADPVEAAKKKYNHFSCINCLKLC